MTGDDQVAEAIGRLSREVSSLTTWLIIWLGVICGLLAIIAVGVCR